ncbi:MAG: type II secretion system F family protein [Kineosporiaceae bacterium]
MSLGPAYVAALTTTCLAIAYGVHRWLLLGEAESIRRRLGGPTPNPGRWSRTDAALERIPGLGALARQARLARLPLGITDLVLLTSLLGYLTLQVLEALLGPTAARPLTILLVPWAVWSLVSELARRRREQIVAQIPDVVRLLAGGAKAGLSVSASLTQAADDVGEPISTELRRLVASLDFGRPLPAALEDFGSRIRSRDLDIVISAIAIQQRTGGDLVALLTRLGVGLEMSRRARREARSITAGLSGQAYVGVMLGFGGVVLINRITDGGLERALQEPVIAAVFAVSALLLVASVPIVRRIVRLPS